MTYFLYLRKKSMHFSSFYHLKRFKFVQNHLKAKLYLKLFTFYLKTFKYFKRYRYIGKKRSLRYLKKLLKYKKRFFLKIIQRKLKKKKRNRYKYFLKHKYNQRYKNNNHSLKYESKYYNKGLLKKNFFKNQFKISSYNLLKLKFKKKKYKSVNFMKFYLHFSKKLKVVRYRRIHYPKFIYFIKKKPRFKFKNKKTKVLSKRKMKKMQKRKKKKSKWRFAKSLFFRTINKNNVIKAYNTESDRPKILKENFGKKLNTPREKKILIMPKRYFYFPRYFKKHTNYRKPYFKNYRCFKSLYFFFNSIAFENQPKFLKANATNLNLFYSVVKRPYMIGKLIFRYTKNNMFISLVNSRNVNKLIYKTSAGQSGFKGPTRPTFYAKEKMSKLIAEKAVSLNYKIIDIHLKHRPNKYIYHILKGLGDNNMPIRFFSAHVNSTHGYVRLKKRRRL